MRYLFLLFCIHGYCLTTSVIIPCHPDHFSLLEPLLVCYQNQTVVPDEIVVSLSEASKVSAAALIALEEMPWPFSLKILKHKGKYPPGKNRNEACTATSGELIICQDADDIPHPQRVEIIRYLFEKNNLDHLLHQWISSAGQFEWYEIETVSSKVVSFRAYDLIDLPNIHNGNNAFRRSVFDSVHWKPMTQIQEDVLFNRSAYSFCKKKGVLELPLIMYRPELSTFDLDGTKEKRD